MCDCIDKIKVELLEHYKIEGKEIAYFYNLSDEWEGHYEHTTKTGNVTKKVVKFTVQTLYCPHCGKKK